MYVFQDPPPILISKAIKLPLLLDFPAYLLLGECGFFLDNNPFYKMKFGDFIEF